MDTPKLPPLVAQSNGKYTYICTFTNKWDKDKQRSYRAGSVTVGKIDGGSKVGVIKWTEAFLEEPPEFKNFVATRKLVTNNGKNSYEIELSKPSAQEDKLIPLKDSLDLKKLNVGVTWLFDEILSDTPLASALKMNLSTNKLDIKLLSQAYFKLIEPERSIDFYEIFATYTKLPFKKALAPRSITKILQEIDAKSILQFLKTLKQECTLQDDKNINHTNVYYALEANSIATSSFDQENNFGQFKDLDNLKQFNVLMMVNQDTGCPIYYKEYQDAKPNIATVIDILKDAKLKDCQKPILVSNRDYDTIISISKLLKNNQSFIFNLSTKFTLVKKEIAKVLNTLLDDCDYNRKIGLSHVTLKQDFKFPSKSASTLDKARSKETAPLYIHVFLDHYKREIAQDEFRYTLRYLLDKQNLYLQKLQFISQLKKGESLKNKAYTTEDLERFENELSSLKLSQEEQAWIDKFTCFDADHKRIVNNKAKENYLTSMCIRVLVSDTVSDPVKAHLAYEDRVEVEKCFRSVKDYTLDVFEHISNFKILTGKFFVHFLAASIQCLLRQRIYETKIRRSKYPTEFDASIEKLIANLSTITQIVFNGANFISGMDNKKKKIYKALKVELPSTQRNKAPHFNDEDLPF